MKETAKIATNNGSIYIKRLCKHFSHKVPAEFSNDKGQVNFSIGDCIMKSDENHLEFLVSADSEKNLEATKDTVIRHLHKFSRDEELTVKWYKQD